MDIVSVWNRFEYLIVISQNVVDIVGVSIKGDVFIVAGRRSIDGNGAETFARRAEQGRQESLRRFVAPR